MDHVMGKNSKQLIATKQKPSPTKKMPLPLSQFTTSGSLSAPRSLPRLRWPKRYDTTSRYPNPKPDMGKKGVPDWLNSSLWSSTADDRFSRYATKSSPESPPRRPLPIRNPSPPPPPPSSDLLHEDPESDVGSQNPKPVKLSPEEASRQALLVAEVMKKVINVGELQRLVCQGIPDGAEIRATIWKLLLRYLPYDRALWRHELDKKRSQYKAFKDELLLNPSEITRRMDEFVGHKDEDLNCGGSGFLPRSEITHGEHPLSLGSTSVWNQFFQDTEIIEQIDRDVKRTHPDMPFFSEDSSFAKSNQEALRHILIVFAKLNPGIRYVQGMNEVLAPLFYVFRNDPDENSAANAEADTFFCFVELLSGFRDNFCKQLDNSVVGIRSTIAKLSQLLKKHDEELWRHLEVTTKVNPQFYAFRWITLLLTQEFNFTDCLHIWDNLLSDPEGPQETLLRICCAMLILVRRRLLAGDFTSNLKLLQNYPTTNISHLLHVANKLRGALTG